LRDCYVRKVRRILKNNHGPDLRDEQSCGFSATGAFGSGAPPENSRALHCFAILTATTTFCLLALGGLVTSHGAGMAVPDWPNTYGYNMFFFPVSQWVGGIFYEHTHRLLASGVGLLTAVLAIWLHGNRARPFLRWAGVAMLAFGLLCMGALPARWADASVFCLVGGAAFGASCFWPRCQPSPKWLRMIGLAAFLAVVLQGILGGLRVVLFKDQIGIFHATLAQLFFALLCAVALLTSGWWSKTRNSSSLPQIVKPEIRGDALNFRWWFIGTTMLIVLQLVIGATMRHQHAGLAIPDFPLAYGKVWPGIDSVSVAHYNQQRMEITALNSITASQIVLQLVHRFMALLILVAAAVCAWRVQLKLGAKHFLTKLARSWLGLVLIQALLGASTIWSNKAADIATAHVVFGALTLAVGTIGSMVLSRFWAFLPTPSPAGAGVGGQRSGARARELGQQTPDLGLTPGPAGQRG